MTLKYRPWEIDEITLLRSWPRESPTWIDDLADSINRTIPAIIAKCQKLKIPCPGSTSALYGHTDPRVPFWTEQRLAILQRCHAEGYDYIQRRQTLNCSRQQLTIGHQKLGIRFHHQWTEAQLKAAREYPRYTRGKTYAKDPNYKSKVQVAREVGVPATRFISMIAAIRQKERLNAKAKTPAKTSSPELQLPVQGQNIHQYKD